MKASSVHSENGLEKGSDGFCDLGVMSSYSKRNTVFARVVLAAARPRLAYEAGSASTNPFRPPGRLAGKSQRKRFDP